MHFLFRHLFLVFAFLFCSSASIAHPGIGIVMDSKGNVFYTDLEHVWKISPEGRKSIAVKNVHTHELYLDSQDNLFGEDVRYEGEKTDRWHHRIWKRSPGGKVSDLFGERPGFREDFGLVQDQAGTHYWIQYQGKISFIRKRLADGRISTVKADKPLGRLGWLAVSEDGKTLYATSDTGFFSISRTGKVTELLHKPHPERHTFFGIWPGQDGSVYVAVYNENAIKKVAKTGEVTVVAKTAAPWAPTGLVIAPDQALWLLEYSTSNEARVRKIDAQGRVQVF